MSHLGETNVTPDALTLAGVTLCAGAAVLVWLEYLGWGFFLAGAAAFVVGSVLDILDGALARTSGKGTPFGAFLDSTVDRVGEGFVLGAIALVLAREASEWGVALTFAAVAGSFLVSYTRARAEALGVECKVGFAQRPPRVVILAVGIVFGAGAGLGDFSLLAPSIYALALLTSVTALQRVLHVRRELRAAGGV
jgi:CDP-diacylglycerol--glycerol-3-phosphate 3-phosphatidyltransferase